MTITARPAPNAAPVRLKVRKSIDSLSAQELADFRRAVKQATALNDKRGFDYFASWHGVPFGWCQHHDALFLPWHRAYLYWLELALQSQVPGVTLPWWDWSKDAAGCLTVFAHGDCWGDVGHCDIPEPVSAFDRRPPHPLLPFDATLEVTEALAALPADTAEFTVTVLAFNKNSDTEGVLRFKELTLLTYA